MTETIEVLRVGRIVKPHGIDGELVVEPYTDFPEERFGAGRELLLLEGDDETVPVTAQGYRWHQDRILLELQEVPDRNRAEEVRDCWLAVPEAEAIEDAQAYYGYELVGLAVRDEAGNPRGSIRAVHPDRMNPLAEITLDDDVIDFPLSENLILELNPDENYIVLDFPRGWEKLKRD